MKQFILCLGIVALSQTAHAVEASLAVSSTDQSAQTLSCEETATFTGKSVVYKNDANYRCDYYDEQRAIRSAEDAANQRCYASGFSRCTVRSSVLTINGYLGYQEGFSQYLGYGCLATAIVHGGR